MSSITKLKSVKGAQQDCGRLILLFSVGHIIIRGDVPKSVASGLVIILFDFNIDQDVPYSYQEIHLWFITLNCKNFMRE
jgi:hypothetical protein